MKKRLQLLTHEDGTPAKGQHKKSCTDCPWARKAVNGWLGNMGVDEWLQSAHGEGDAECHVHLGAKCAGFATYRANVAKLPRDPNALRLPSNHERVFSNPMEFKEHHENKLRKPHEEPKTSEE